MRMICDRCWERRCKCSPRDQADDRAKVIEGYRKAEGLPEGWKPGAAIHEQKAPQKQEGGQ
jgi:hypothetical protein